MSGRLQGRVAVVTGAARGFGFAIARRFVAEGARVTLMDRDAERLAEAAERIGTPDMTHTVEVDVTEPDAVEAAVASARERFGRADSLVNNAGIAVSAEPWDVTIDSWRQIIDVNLNGTFWCIKACLPDMMEAKYGKIVNTGSIAAMQARPHAHPAYAASKGGVLSLTATVSRAVGPYGICVNAINPGFIRTEIHEGWSEQQLARFQTDIPLRKHGGATPGGTPDDIAATALFLVSADSDYINGEFVNVNGGTVTG